jgi:hypothetical protein
VAITNCAYTSNGLNQYTAVSGLTGIGHDTTTSFTYNPASQIATNQRTNDPYAWTGQSAVNRDYTASGLNQYTATQIPAGTTSYGDGAKHWCCANCRATR